MYSSWNSLAPSLQQWSQVNSETTGEMEPLLILKASGNLTMNEAWWQSLQDLLPYTSYHKLLDTLYIKQE